MVQIQFKTFRLCNNMQFQFLIRRYIVILSFKSRVCKMIFHCYNLVLSNRQTMSSCTYRDLYNLCRNKKRSMSLKFIRILSNYLKLRKKYKDKSMISSMCVEMLVAWQMPLYSSQLTSFSQFLSFPFSFNQLSLY